MKTMLANASIADTRTVLLDVAEKLFAQCGVEGVSIRDIAKEAGANLGAVNYHFESKDNLVLEVFARRIEPVNRDRIALLDALEARKAAPTLEEIIEALIRPAVVDETTGQGRGDNFIRMITRLNHEPSDNIKALRVKHLLPLVMRFDAAILKAVPGLPREELYWRMHFLLGALHHGLDRWAGRDQMLVSPGMNRKKLQIDGEGFIARFVAFAAAGLRASAPCTPAPIRVKRGTGRQAKAIS